MPTNKLRKIIWKGVNTKASEILIMVCICLNMLQMAMAYENSSEQYRIVLDILNLIFTAAFTAEALLKIVAFGFK